MNITMPVYAFTGIYAIAPATNKKHELDALSSVRFLRQDGTLKACASDRYIGARFVVLDDGENFDPVELSRIGIEQFYKALKKQRPADTDMIELHINENTWTLEYKGNQLDTFEYNDEPSIEFATIFDMPASRTVKERKATFHYRLPILKAVIEIAKRAKAETVDLEQVDNSLFSIMAEYGDISLLCMPIISTKHLTPKRRVQQRVLNKFKKTL